MSDDGVAPMEIDGDAPPRVKREKHSRAAEQEEQPDESDEQKVGDAPEEEDAAADEPDAEDDEEEADVARTALIARKLHTKKRLKEFIDAVDDGETQQYMLTNQSGITSAGDTLDSIAKKIDQTDVSNSLLDAQGFKVLSALGHRQAHQLTSTSKIDVDDLMTKFQERFGTATDNGVEIDFYKFGREVSHRFRSVDCTSFMKGLLGLQVAVKEKKAAQRKKRGEEEEEAPLVRAQAMLDTSKEAGGVSMTDKRVDQLFNHLPDEKSDFFRTLMHPSSFTQSIENLFDLTFLIKKGRAEVSLHEELRIPMVRRVLDAEDMPDDDEEDAQAKFETANFQCIIKMDQTTWRKIIHAWKLAGLPPKLPDRSAQYKKHEAELRDAIAARSAPSASQRRSTDASGGPASGSKRRRTEEQAEEALERMPALATLSQPTMRSYVKRTKAPSAAQMREQEDDEEVSD
jgi:hypothetical protein